MANVTLTNVDKTYAGNVKAVDNVSLEIHDQEFLVLVGPSGCGKTTTLRMIAGLEEISAGTIQIDDRVVNDVAPKDRDIAMVFQNYALYPHMTVYQNLAFALKLRKTAKAAIDERVRWAAETLGIESLLGRRPRQLSGGQRQRVAVGRAIVRQPKVFLFDEPLSNLDAKLRVTTRAELKKLQQALKTTTVYVTHDQEEAMTLGDRVVVMHGGKIQQYGTPLEIYRHPANRFVAGFMGMPPMNFLEGSVMSDHGVMRLDLEDFPFEFRHPCFRALQSHVGKEISVGIRPECMRIGSVSEADGTIEGRVEVIEMLGHAMDVFLSTRNKITLVCRVPADQMQDSVSVGKQVTAGVRAADLHLFEDNGQGTGVRLIADAAFA